MCCMGFSRQAWRSAPRFVRTRSVRGKNIEAASQVRVERKMYVSPFVVWFCVAGEYLWAGRKRSAHASHCAEGGGSDDALAGYVAARHASHRCAQSTADR